MKITAKLSEGVLTLALPSRIDTTNASEVEEGLKKAIEAHQGFEELNLDAKGLEYISSVGLRVLLRLRRAHGDMMVTEVKPEVYDIFEMTGFTEMMEVRKGYRTISIEGCPLIGEGYFGKVYRISPDAIVKMYFRTPGPEMSIKERSRAKMAFVLGIPTAISYEVVRIAGTENTFGSVFELVDAKSMDSIMKKEPSRIKEMEDVYCNLLKTISATKVPSNDLPSAKDYGREWLKVIVPYLGKDLGNKVTSLIESIADEDCLIHGDCHMKNIFVTNGEPLLIDMETISRGNHIFEYAPLYGSFFVYEMAIPDNDLKFFGLPAEVVQPFFMNALKRLYSGKSEAEFAEMMTQLRFLAACLILYRTLTFTPDAKSLIDVSMTLIEEGAEKLDHLGLD